MTLSPDGRWIATTEVDEAAGKQTIVLIAVEDGSRRKVMESSAPQWFNRFALTWTPDSSAVLARKILTASFDSGELWQVPIGGDAPRRLDVDVRGRLYAPGSIQLNRDGRQLAYVVGGSDQEVWVLENALSALNSKPLNTKPLNSKQR